MRLTKEQLELANLLTTENAAKTWTENRVITAQLIMAALLTERAILIKEANEWQRRAAAHGCNIDDGDPDCG